MDHLVDVITNTILSVILRLDDVCYMIVLYFFTCGPEQSGGVMVSPSKHLGEFPSFASSPDVLEELLYKLHLIILL